MLNQESCAPSSALGLLAALQPAESTSSVTAQGSCDPHIESKGSPAHGAENDGRSTDALTEDVANLFG